MLQNDQMIDLGEQFSQFEITIKRCEGIHCDNSLVVDMAE